MELVAVEADFSRFKQLIPFGPYVMEIVIELLEPDRLTYGWWWAEAGGVPIEQSKADARCAAS